MRVNKKLKETLKTIKENSNIIPREFWGRESTIWLQENFGIKPNGSIIMDYEGERRNFSFKTFFLKCRTKPCIDERIIKTAKEYIFLIKLQKGRLTAMDIVKCRNIEIRRFLLMRFGYRKFVEELKGVIVHEGKDGSELIKINWHKGEEPLKLVKVRDPSTDRVYILRVPPYVKTCKEAIARTFGMSQNEYNPLKET